MNTNLYMRKINTRIFKLFAACVLAGLSTAAYSDESMAELRFPLSRPYIPDTKSIKLAANDTEIVKSNTNLTKENLVAEYEPPLITKNKIHQYLGLSTIALAGLTAMTSPEDCDEGSCPPRDITGTHATLAKATVAMALATIATGIYAHWDDFSLKDGWSDPDNLHVILGLSGTALMAYAVNKSANSSVPVNHAAMAESGALLMVVAIKLTW